MTKEKAKACRDIAEKCKKLDELDLILAKNTVDTLAMRHALEEKEEEDAKVNS